MEYLSAPVTEKQDKGLCGLDAGTLADVSGGMFIVVGDGYCGTPYPWPPRPLTLGVSSLVSNPAPALIAGGG